MALGFQRSLKLSDDGLTVPRFRLQSAQHNRHQLSGVLDTVNEVIRNILQATQRMLARGQRFVGEDFKQSRTAVIDQCPLRDSCVVANREFWCCIGWRETGLFVRMPEFRDRYLGKTDPRNPLASPVFGDYRGLPPLLIPVGEHEMLRDDSVRVSQKARADGIRVKLEVWPGMVHVFQIRRLPESRAAIQHIADFMRSCLPRPR